MTEREKPVEPNDATRRLLTWKAHLDPNEEFDGNQVRLNGFADGPPTM